jgi:hypothetical protein
VSEFSASGSVCCAWVLPAHLARPCIQETIVVLLQLEESEDWEDEVDDVIKRWEQQTGRQATYTICFY